MGIGFGEIIVILVLALIFVGPQKLPDLARQAGKMFVHFRRMTTDVRSSVETIIRQAEDEIRKEEQAALKNLLAVAKSAEISKPEHSMSFDPNHGHHQHEHQDPNAQTLIDLPPHEPNLLTPPESANENLGSKSENKTENKS